MRNSVWLPHLLPLASKFVLRQLAGKTYALLNKELDVEDIQDYLCAIGDYSKDSLINECERHLRLIHRRGLHTRTAGFPAVPRWPMRWVPKDPLCFQ